MGREITRGVIGAQAPIYTRCRKKSSKPPDEAREDVAAILVGLSGDDLRRALVLVSLAALGDEDGARRYLASLLLGPRAHLE